MRAACISCLMLLFPLFQYCTSCLAQEEGDSVLKALPDGAGEELPSASVDLPAPVITPSYSSVAAPLPRSSLQVTPWSNYFNLSSGDTAFGGGIGLDLNHRLDESGNIVAHGGAGISSISGGTLATYTVDVSKLALTESRRFSDRLSLGAGVDIFSMHDLLPQNAAVAQIQTGLGYALSERSDVGVFTTWPLTDDAVRETNLLIPDPIFPTFQTIERRVELSRQVQAYWSRTVTEALDVLAFVGHREAPDAWLYGVDLAWALNDQSALFSGVNANDHGAVTFFLGFQLTPSAAQVVPARRRGGYHRLTRGGLFRTLNPAEANVALKTVSPRVVNTFQMNP